MKPYLGQIVLFNHVEDVKTYPALVLGFDDEGDPLLQVFRPRGNYWVYSVEGTGPGQWRVTEHDDMYSHPDAIPHEEAPVEKVGNKLEDPKEKKP